jgi:hypothetical protein
MHHSAQRNQARERTVDREVAKLEARQHRARGERPLIRRIAFIDKTTGRAFKQDA